MKLEKLSLAEHYKKHLALDEDEKGKALYRMLRDCEGAGKVEGAVQMLEALNALLTPGIRKLGADLVLKLQHESSAQLLEQNVEGGQ